MLAHAGVIRQPASNPEWTSRRRFEVSNLKRRPARELTPPWDCPGCLEGLPTGRQLFENGGMFREAGHGARQRGVPHALGDAIGYGRNLGIRGVDRSIDGRSFAYGQPWNPTVELVAPDLAGQVRHCPEIPRLLWDPSPENCFDERVALDAGMEESNPKGLPNATDIHVWWGRI
jgi:hypothetical protein